MNKTFSVLLVFAFWGTLTIANASISNKIISGKIMNDTTNLLSTNDTVQGVELPKLIDARNCAQFKVDTEKLPRGGGYFVTYLDSKNNGCLIEFAGSTHDDYRLSAVGIGKYACIKRSSEDKIIIYPRNN